MAGYGRCQTLVETNEEGREAQREKDVDQMLLSRLTADADYSWMTRKEGIGEPTIGGRHDAMATERTVSGVFRIVEHVLSQASHIEFRQNVVSGPRGCRAALKH